ncbi:MAG: N-acetyl-gamma-glutamyl-phosphate reductase [Candidatus Omnitrophica bacterium]|nr:N-acetyl-gamma-glutamyl-phosphate reductase [Candidatus Omnitrophota bacterium]
MIKVGVIGATGYTGEEIIKILAGHKNVEITVLQAVVEKEELISDIFPALKGRVELVCQKPDIAKATQGAELFFLALPHRVSMKVVPALIEAGKKVIDLSADYRLEADEYEKWYGESHKDKANIPKAVYGLPELFRNEIKKAKLLANPGCYPTGAALAITPLLKKGCIDTTSVIIDAKSGATGAGRKALLALSLSEVNENLKAYKINEHQHKPEINMVASKVAGRKIDVIFVPHLVPMNRGILSTVYAGILPGNSSAFTADGAIELYRDFYKNEPFVKVMGKGIFPAIRDVQYTNLCNIGVKVTGSKIIIVSCIDNLLKGAAGQAVQNMNIMCGFDETEGLI